MPSEASTPVTDLTPLVGMPLTELGFRSTKVTDISPLTKISFQPVRAASALAAADIDRFVLPEAGARLTFVDGVYAPQLSANDSTVEVSTIADRSEVTPGCR